MKDIPILEIYLDILFLLNLVMDYFVFWIVSKIMYQRITKKRLCLGSIIAALSYCMITVVPFLRNINIIVYLIVLPILPIKIIFKPLNFKQFFQIFIVSNITALAVGGIGFGTYYWIKDQNVMAYIYQKGYKEFSIWTLLMSIGASYFFIQLARYYMQKRNTTIQKLYSLKITYNDLAIETEAFLDTGNKVYDPITKYPVIIVEYKIIKMLLPDDIKNAFENANDDISFLIQEASKSKLGTRIRAIPYHSLGNPNGILLGFRPDTICICNHNHSWNFVENVIIAIYQHDIHMEGTYHALLHADIANKI